MFQKIICDYNAVEELKTIYSYNDSLVPFGRDYSQAVDYLITQENNVSVLSRAFEVIKENQPRGDNGADLILHRILSRASLLASGVNSEQIDSYQKKLDYLWNEFTRFKDDYFITRSTIEQGGDPDFIKLEALSAFLWKEGEGRYTEEEFRLDKAIDNQIRYMNIANTIDHDHSFKNNIDIIFELFNSKDICLNIFDNADIEVPVANCVGLTSLYTVLSKRMDLRYDLAVITTNDHMFNQYNNIVIENTLQNGFVERPIEIEDNFGYILENNSSSIQIRNEMMNYNSEMNELSDEFGIVSGIILNSAADYYIKGDNQKALACLYKIIEFDPYSSYAQVLLGMVYGDMKEYIKAVDAFKRAIEINPDNYFAYYQFADFYYEIEEYETALQYLDKANISGYTNLDVYELYKKLFSKLNPKFKI